MSKFSRHETRDYETMTCDYDNDHFNQGLRFSIPVKAVIVMVNGHSQKVPCPASNDIEVCFEQLLKTP